MDTGSLASIFLEIGPHSALAGPLRQIFRGRGSSDKDEYVPTLTRNTHAMASLMKTAGELWLRDIAVDFNDINGKGSFLVGLALYPWHYEAISQICSP
jgi:acyl transferase domain-containing protein